MAPWTRPARWAGHDDEGTTRERPREPAPDARRTPTAAVRDGNPPARGASLDQVLQVSASLAGVDELGHRGQAVGGAHRDHGAARRGPPPRRGRARASARPCSRRRWRARSTARCAACSSPPTCCPSDITGVSVFNQDVRDFEFRPGAIFANVVVGDEINRASPKTQSALLESMEEAQVTVDGTTYTLPQPFIVMATQNPIEMEGTYPLPEAQRDRFMARISMGYPSARAELDMLEHPRRRVAARGPRAGDRRRDGVRDGAGGARGARLVGASSSTSSTSPTRPARAPPCGSARRRGRACTCCAPPVRTPRSRGATTSCPTTCSRSPSRSWRTGSSPPARRRWPGARRPTSSATCSSASGSRLPPAEEARAHPPSLPHHPRGAPSRAAGWCSSRPASSSGSPT